MKIKYFAWIKDITKKDYEIFDKDYPADIDELKKMLNKLYPQLEQHLRNDILRFAINMEYSSTNLELDKNDEIAIFPPVSGG